jgi:hypothetical protein
VRAAQQITVGAARSVTVGAEQAHYGGERRYLGRQGADQSVTIGANQTVTSATA